MTLSAWRIVQRRLVRDAFNGEGASRFGGRWNSRGTPVVYVAGSLPLAALEMLVHLHTAELLEQYAVIEVTFDRSLVETVGLAELPRNWRVSPPRPATRQIGDAWTAKGTSAVLQVPSAIIPRECNYLLNARHADFRRIFIGRPQPFRFDPRLA